jgi:hypothetical protein
VTSTLITLAAGFLVAVAVVAVLEANRQRRLKADREIMRRFVRYMTVVDQSRRPW